MKRRIWFMIAVLMLILFTSCSRQPKIYMNDVPDKPNELNQNDFSINNVPQQEELRSANVQRINVSLYFYDEQNNRLTPEIRQILLGNDEELIVRLLDELIQGPGENALQPVIPSETIINKVEQAENILTINLSSEFLKSDKPLISRAALVNTLTELEMIKYVKLYIDGNELSTEGKDGDGALLGLLTKYPNTIADIIALEDKAAQIADVKRINQELYFQDIQARYLLPEVRTIDINDNQYVKAVVEELIKGPVNSNEGFYATLPKGTKLQKTEWIPATDNAQQGIALYFSKEFRTQFTGGSSQESIMLGSLVYSLTTLPNIEYIKIFYENEMGDYTDNPVHNSPLNQGLRLNQFADMIGRRIRVYFGDKQGMSLIPEYRAMARNNPAVAQHILSVLSADPTNQNSVRVIPEGVLPGSFTVKTSGDTAIVDLPTIFFDERIGNAGKIRDLYAIVNSLTDPINIRGIKQVKFTVNGNNINMYKDISLVDPFVRNSALIKE